MHGLAYMDPEGKTTPPVAIQSCGNLTPINGCLRFNFPTSTTQNNYLIFQWCPSDLRGISLLDDGTWNIVTYRIPQLTSNAPYATRPLRMSLEILNTSSYTNSTGQVLVAMSPQQILWNSILLNDGLHGTAAGIASLDSFITSFTRTKTLAAADFIKPKKWVFAPASHVGYSEWLDFGPANYTAYGAAYLRELEPGADQDALTTLIVKMAPSASVNNYVYTIRIQEACRYPLNTVLGNLSVQQPTAPPAVVQALHSEASNSNHNPIGSVFDSIMSGVQTGTRLINSVSNLLGGVNMARAIQGSSLARAAPIVEEIESMAPLAIAL